MNGEKTNKPAENFRLVVCLKASYWKSSVSMESRVTLVRLEIDVILAAVLHWNEPPTRTFGNLVVATNTANGGER